MEFQKKVYSVKNENGTFDNYSFATSSETVEMKNGKTLEVEMSDVPKVNEITVTSLTDPSHLYKTDVVDNLYSTLKDKPLSANQGRQLSSDIGTVSQKFSKGNIQNNSYGYRLEAIGDGNIFETEPGVYLLNGDSYNRNYLPQASLHGTCVKFGDINFNGLYTKEYTGAIIFAKEGIWLGSCVGIWQYTWVKIS